MPSDMDAVIEEFTVEDAEFVVDALRDQAITWRHSPETRDRLRLIANHLAMEAGKVRMNAEQRELLKGRT